jgi:hypothetical protein
VPQAAPSHTYSLRAPLPRKTDTTRPVRKRPQRDRLALIRSTLRQYCLFNRLTRASTLGNDAGKALGVPAGRRRLGHATALDVGLLLLPFKLRPPIHHISSRLHRGRPRPRQHADWLRHCCVTTTSSLCRSPSRLGVVKGVVRLDADCAATKPMEKIPHAQPRASFQNGVTIRGDRLVVL